MIEITIGKTLNPELWDGMKLDPEVREKLLDIAKHFADYLDISEDAIKYVYYTSCTHGRQLNFICALVRKWLY